MKRLLFLLLLLMSTTVFSSAHEQIPACQSVDATAHKGFTGDSIFAPSQFSVIHNIYDLSFRWDSSHGLDKNAEINDTGNFITYKSVQTDNVYVPVYCNQNSDKKRRCLMMINDIKDALRADIKEFAYSYSLGSDEEDLQSLKCALEKTFQYEERLLKVNLK